MTTQLFKAKDVRSAISKVTEEFGDEAIILSTKKNNGFVEIEASNNNEVLTSFPRKNEESKVFSKIFYKKLDENNLTLPQKRDEVKKTESTQEKIKRPINNFDKLRRSEVAVPPEINLTSLIALTTTSFIFFSPFNTFERLNSGLTPSKTWEFAIPKSVSSSKTSLDNFLNAMDKFTDIVVFPTPPFPLVIAIESDTLEVLFHIFC